jgi:hypothetical protein
MALDLGDVRPPVLREATVRALDPLRRFPHFVRHAYAVVWDRGKLEEALDLSLAAWPSFRADAETFVAWARSVAA